MSYLVIGFFVLASAVTSRFYLLLISSESAHFEKYNQTRQDLWLGSLLITNCAPYLLTFLISFINILFRQSANPSLGSIGLSVTFATLEAVSTSFLMAIVFPRLDLVRSLLLLNTISFIPSTFKLIYELFQSNPFRTRKFHFLRVIFNFFACLMQYSVVLIVIIGEFNQINEWILPVSLVLFSLASSKDFIYVSLASFNLKYLVKLKSTMQLMHESRHKLGLFTSLYKIGVTLLVYHFYNQDYLLQMRELNFSYMRPFLVQLASFLVFFISCSLAFKLRMHRLAFLIPLALVTPISVVLSVVLCDQSVKYNNTPFKEYYFCTATSFTTDPYR